MNDGDEVFSKVTSMNYLSESKAITDQENYGTDFVSGDDVMLEEVATKMESDSIKNDEIIGKEYSYDEENIDSFVGKGGVEGLKGVDFELIPKSRVKKLMKSDPEVKLISQDALVLATASVEMFIGYLAEETGKQTLSDGRKVVQFKDLVNAVQLHRWDNLDFLDDVIYR